jgi:enamine deaminase RidA (YjgF/YER057c/UK114 family)
MNRTDVNPWEWSKAFGFSQAVKLDGPQTMLICAGQTATGDDGSVPTTTDMGEQVQIALKNLTKVLGEAGMSMSDVVRVNIYTTDVDELLGAYGSAAELLGSNLPAMTLLGVSRLAFPELKVEIEAIAAR